MPTKTAQRLIQAARELRHAVGRLTFSDPVAHVYNPLDYAWAAHEQYLARFATGRRRVLMLGMNPGPWGMAQTGVPFGEVAAVRDWMGINAPITTPTNQHPKRRVEGLGCSRSEVSGRRLWGLMAERFTTPDAFFREHFVANYCPLVFMEASARNRTPDKLPAAERAPLEKACDNHLNTLIQVLKPQYLIGVGGFAQACLRRVSVPGLLASSAQIGRVLHPSPASPAANRGWAEQASKQLIAQGVWAA